MYSFECYHGTFHHNTHYILQDGFEKNRNDDDWLGDGVYFFDNYTGESGKVSARKWAYKKWYDSNRIFRKYAVIKCYVDVENNYLLDLSIPSQFDYFQRLREEYISDYKDHGKPLTRSGTELDTIIIRKICKKTRVDVARKIDFIKFRKDCRLNANSRIPNCVIICVKEISCIRDVEEIEVGDINDRSEEYL